MRIENDKYYKIRHIPTGLYKTGGINDRFTTHGKVWKGSRVKNHLRQFSNYRTGEMHEGFASGDHFFRDCEIIEYQLIDTNCQNLLDFVHEEM